MSPQTRRGRTAPASHKARVRPDAEPKPAPKPAAKPAAKPAPEAASAPAADPAPVSAPAESRPHAEGKRAKVAATRHKKQHGTAYRWIRAYLPLMAGLFVLLAALWVYTSIINPPPPSPASQWATIEAKWSPAREKARAAVAGSTLDFNAQLAAYKDFYTQTKGWVDDVNAVKDWGAAHSTDVSAFVSVGGQYVTQLQTVTTATTAYDVANAADTISQFDATFTADVATVDADFGQPVASPPPSPLAMPSVNPTPTPTPEPTPTLEPSGSPVPTVSPAPSTTDTPAPTAVPTAS